MNNFVIKQKIAQNICFIIYSPNTSNKIKVGKYQKDTVNFNSNATIPFQKIWLPHIKTTTQEQLIELNSISLIELAFCDMKLKTLKFSTRSDDES